MKWVFATNDHGLNVLNYHRHLIEISLYSCKKYTDLEPVCLYDGKDKSFLNFLEKNEVICIPCESPIKKPFLDYKSSNKTHVSSGVVEGTFLRYEIANHINDKLCLYTDIDVLFQEGFKIPGEQPERWAMFRDESGGINSAVILFNVDDFKKEYPIFISNACNKIKDWINGPYDQGYINKFYYESVEKLNQNYNWSTFVGINKDAKIVHFIGPKPNDTRNHVPSLSVLINTPGYQYYNEQFNRLKLELGI